MSSEINETFITQQEVSNFMIIRQLIRHLQAKGLTVEGLFSTPVVDAEVQQVKHKIKQGKVLRALTIKVERFLCLNDSVDGNI